MNSQSKRQVFEVLAVTFLTVALLRQIDDPDIWFHLSIGREIFNTLSIPAKEFLVFPNAGKAGDFHEWGFGLLHFLSYKTAGFWGMSLVNALISSLIFLFLFKAAKTRPGVDPFHIVALVAIISWMDYRLVYRPETLLYLALAAEIFLLERFCIHKNWRWLIPIPFVGFVLNLAHPSLAFLIGMLGAYMMQLAWEHRKDKPLLIRYSKWFVAVGACTMMLAVINPYGVKQIILPFEFLAATRVTNTVAEFQSVIKTGFQWTYLILVVVGAIALLLNQKKRPLDWLLYLLFGYLAFRYVRNVALFALVMYVPVARGFSDAAELFGSWLKKSRPQVWMSVFRIISWGGAFAALAAIFSAPYYNPRWGAGPVPGMFPETAVRVIKKIRPPGRIYNFYDLGGYLGWVLDGEYQVFIDGRHYNANRALSVYHSVDAARPGWQTALDRYGVNIIVTQGTYTFTAALIPLVVRLASDPAWELVARGERALLFLRKSAVPSLPAQYILDKREVWEQIAMEAEVNISAIPDQAPAYNALGEALFGLGDREGALRAFRHYVKLVPEDRKSAARLEELEAQL